MSALHILNVGGGPLCGANVIRGFIDLADYRKLRSANKLRTQIKTSVKHSCDSRYNSTCYKGKDIANCPRRSYSRSAVCMACERRA